MLGLGDIGVLEPPTYYSDAGKYLKSVAHETEAGRLLQDASKGHR